MMKCCIFSSRKPSKMSHQPQQLISSRHRRPRTLTRGHFKCPQGIPYRGVKPSGEAARNVRQDGIGSGLSRSRQVWTL